VRTLERAGCYIVGDDFLQVFRWHTAPVAETGDPIAALSNAFLQHSIPSASVFQRDGRNGEALVEAVRASRADGVVFAAPSFCDPALLDQPMNVAALDRAGIPYTALKYAENTGQFQVIREQAGTFADSIRLWGDA
jgi:benzoyl-CoA reductase subunit C